MFISWKVAIIQRDYRGFCLQRSYTFFDHPRFDYQKLEKFSGELKDKCAFDGAILPTSTTADHLINWDGYDDAIHLVDAYERKRYENMAVLRTVPLQYFQAVFELKFWGLDESIDIKIIVFTRMVQELDHYK